MSRGDSSAAVDRVLERIGLWIEGQDDLRTLVEPADRPLEQAA